MVYEDLRRSIVRVSVLDAATSLGMLGGALALGLANWDGASDLTVIGLIAGPALCLLVLSPLFVGIPRREANELRVKIRPRWRFAVYFGMLFFVGVLTFPGADSLTGHKFNGIAAILAIMAVSNLTDALYNLANASRVAERLAVDTL